MRHLLRELKKTTRQAHKNWQFWVQGQAKDYCSRTATQTLDDGYLWSHCHTPIMARSTDPQVNERRLQNMQLAASKFNGLIIAPGQVVGFWNRVPRPTRRNGFQPGPMLVRGQLTSEIGGGLCQISTTLYQALLWANLEILERYNHSIDAHGEARFFTLGQDAAVAYGYKDLIAKNPTPIALRLELRVDADQAQVVANVFGEAANPYELKLESTVLAAIAPPSVGAKPGAQVRTRRWSKTSMSDWILNYETIDHYHPYV